MKPPVTDEMLHDIGRALGVRYDANGYAIQENAPRDHSQGERAEVTRQTEQRAGPRLVKGNRASGI